MLCMYRVWVAPGNAIWENPVCRMLRSRWTHGWSATATSLGSSAIAP
jgi:hypothetical protein